MLKTWADLGIPSIHTLSRAELELFQNRIPDLTDKERGYLSYIWPLWARPNQMAPPEDDWLIWAMQAGRGFGKTRALAEHVRACAEMNPGMRIALCGRTEEEVAKVFIHGTSSLLNLSPPEMKPHHHIKDKYIQYPNGSRVFLHSAAEPEKFRGPEYHMAALDELAAYQRESLWDNLTLGVRLQDFGNPKIIIATTPKTTPIFRKVREGDGVLITRGATQDNMSNLPESFIKEVEKRYKGTRFYRQEVLGEYLDEVEGALWSMAWIEGKRAQRPETDEQMASFLSKFDRVVIAVDPAISTGKRSNLTGIVCAGKLGDEYYVIEDASMSGSPQQWASVVVRMYYKYSADLIVCEANNGGDLVLETIKRVDDEVNVKKVYASRGKVSRAEPVSALYEQGKVRHLGEFPALEDQLCTYEPGDASPDRMDALVWAILELSYNKRRTLEAVHFRITDENIKMALDFYR